MMPRHLEVKLLIVGLWFFAVYVHELGHAVTAYVGGDSKVKERGGFSPIRIWLTSPMLSLVIPLLALLIGGLPLPGAAVTIDRAALRTRTWVAMTFAAGPAATILVTLAMLVAYLGLRSAGDSVAEPLRLALAFLVVMNVMSCLINAAPIPPLDGFGAATAWLPRETLVKVYAVAPYVMIAMLLVLLKVPPISRGLWTVSLWGASLGGVADPDFRAAAGLVFAPWFSRD